MREIMYDLNSFLIAAILFVSMIAFIEVGIRLGRRHSREASESATAQVNTIQASLLGILALLLGFTFSLALQRYDSRSQAVVDEANAIGTTYLRAQLLPEAVRPAATEALHAYATVRVEAARLALTADTRRGDLTARATRLQQELWALAREAARLEPNPVTTGLYVQALNELIDSFASRNAALERHVPEIVLFLLYGTFLMTGMIVGYASGMGRHRASFITYVLVGLIVLLVFIIIDLDRPRRGIIEVRQDSLVQLLDLMAPDASR